MTKVIREPMYIGSAAEMAAATTLGVPSGICWLSTDDYDIYSWTGATWLDITGTGGGIDGIDIKQSGSLIASTITVLNFVGSTITDDGGGQVTISGGGSAATGFYGDVLMDTTVTGSVQATFDLTSISSTYAVIEFFISGTSDGAGTVDNVKIAFNNDTTDANYRFGQHTGGSTHASSAGDNRFIGYLGSSANAFCTGQMIGRLVNPANTTFYKTVHTDFAARDSSTVEYTGSHSVTWESTAAINQITLSFFSQNFSIGTRCIFVGYKNH